MLFRSGGDAGEGTNGANGGNAGSMTIVVESKDTFLLMAVEPCCYDATALKGGLPGNPGAHGRAGKGAPGGKGGKEYTYDESAQVSPSKTKKLRVRVPGGDDGAVGVDGHCPAWAPTSGLKGSSGMFKIKVVGQEQMYDGRYNISFSGLELRGRHPMDRNYCEFGDVVSVSKIRVNNTGGMPIPSAHWIRFNIKDAGDPNVNPMLTSKASIPSGTHLEPEDELESDGVLQFFSGFPNEIPNPDDFDPIIQSTAFTLQAFQWGPVDKRDQTPFKYEYEHFHPSPGHEIKLRYPVENRAGLIGVSSLYPGEATLLKLQIDNVGLESLGGFSSISTQKNRRLAVRFVVSDSVEYDLFPHNINFHIRSHGMQSREVDLSGHGKTLDLPELLPESSYDFTARVSLNQDVKYYSRTALQVDILITSLPLPRGIEVDHDLPSMAVVQRRKFEMICEPKYESVDGASVVLVTSFATSQKQYETWIKEVLTKPMDLAFESYSVSRYGSLDPSFVVENGKTLKDNFSGKLVIVLNDKFLIDHRDKAGIFPVQLLAGGCMSQNSGFDPSTKWLIVGSGSPALVRDLLESHLATEVPTVAEHTDVARFQKVLQKEVLERAMSGYGSSAVDFREDVINVAIPAGEKAAKALEKMATKLCDWLRTTDPLCQYSVEYEGEKGDAMDDPKKGLWSRATTGTMTVRRGYCRAFNSAVVVTGQYTHLPKSITNKGILLSMAEAMSKEMRVCLLCEAIRKSLPAEVMTAFKFAAVSDMIRDLVTFMSCDMKLTEDLELSFPSIGVFLESVEVLSLLRDCKSDAEMRGRTSLAFSEMFARFELVSRSKDLRPRFTLTTSRKKKTVLEAMAEMVERLRLQWKSVLDVDQVEMHKKDLKAEIKEFLKEDVGEGKSINVRADQRWRQGLNYVHSTENQKQFGLANQSKRLIELDYDGEVENYKIFPPAVRAYSSEIMNNVLTNQSLRQDVSRSVIEEIQLTRKAMCLVWEDDIDDESVLKKAVYL